MSAIPLLSELHPRVLERLLDRSVTRSVPRGHVLFLTGETRARVHFVLAGCFLLLQRDLSGTESVVGFATRGRLLDEIGLVDGTLHGCDAIAASDAVVLGIHSDTFRDELAKNSGMARALIVQLEDRLGWITTTATERAGCHVAGRIAGRLLDLASTLGTRRNGAIEVDLPVRQEQLALLAATTRESACKTMRSLKRHGVVEYRGRKLRILRPDALVYLSCGGRAGGLSPSADAGARPLSRSRSGT